MHSLLMGAQMPLLGKHESGCAASPTRAATSMWAEHPLAPGLAGPGWQWMAPNNSAPVLLHDKESHGTAQPALVIDYSRPNSDQAVGLRRSWIWTSLLISLFFLPASSWLAWFSNSGAFSFCSNYFFLTDWLVIEQATVSSMAPGVDGGEKGESAKSKEVRQCLSGSTTKA